MKIVQINQTGFRKFKRNLYSSLRTLVSC